jgi:UDPglucose 6-dehydrogenase
MTRQNGSVREKEKSRKIAVIGCGHVGLVNAAGLAELGHKVIGLDIQEEIVEELSQGKVRFLEPGLHTLVKDNLANGRLRFTTSYSEALRNAQIVMLCVNTPSTVTGAADLSRVRSAAMMIGRELAIAGRHPIVVNKSTSPIGTAETIYAILGRSLPHFLGEPRIASNPEFLREGHAVEDFFQPERIVVGAESDEVADEVKSLYASLESPVISTSIRAAELIKYASNAFLATRVSFVNELARLCEHLGIEVDPVLQGTTLDSRIGSAFFQPGIGYGGSCLPKDVAALCHMGDSFGVPMRVLTAVQDANIGQRRHAVSCLRRALGSLEGRTITVWGLAFKGQSEDFRESPATDVVMLLRNEGTQVRLYDPALQGEDGQLDGLAEVFSDPVEAAKGADALAVLTDWREFAAIDMQALSKMMDGTFVYDGRNILDRHAVEAAGLQYEGVGRPVTTRAFAFGQAETGAQGRSQLTRELQPATA